MSEPAIRASGVSKRYKLGVREPYVTLREAIVRSVRGLTRRGEPGADTALWALKDVSFEVQPGEVVGVIGRNGAGKSTLLKILSRITEPTEGTVDLYGRVGSLLEVGTGFHPELSGRENVFLNGAILGMKRREIVAKFDEIVAFAGVERFVDTPVKHYSSGMYMRLAFAVAANLEPDVLVVDEVLAVGDAEFQRKCLGKMSEVARGGRTVLFVSHNMAAIEQLCSRAILLDGGALSLDADVRSVLEAYTRSIATPASRSLEHVKTRSGAGGARFSEFWLEDCAGAPVDAGRAGHELRLRSRIISTSAAPLRNCRISFGIHDVFGSPLIVLATDLVDGRALEVPSPGEATCKLPRCPLTEGLYRVTLFLECNGVVEDWLQQALELRVESGDYYGTGRTVPASWQGRSVLVDHAWVVQPG